MPRKAREKTATGIHHVILRGINKQIIFEDANDYNCFLDILSQCRDQDHFKILAYCLMGNHVHLLLEEIDVPLSESMKHIEIRFVRWYNNKYDRSGHLFDERYKSEPVYDSRYLLTVFRYIHQNPINAGMEKEVGEYPWSSFAEYLHEWDNLVDRDLITNYFSSNQELISYLQTPKHDHCMEYFSWGHIPDTEAITLIRNMTGCTGPGQFQQLAMAERDRFLLLFMEEGLSIRQISRLTGVSKYSVEKVKEKKTLP